MSNVLIAYFSVSGVTRKAAADLAAATRGDLYEICPEIPYTEADLDYRNKASRSTLEMTDPASRPALKDRCADLSAYDIIYVGYPIWWSAAPHIVNTFLEAYDLHGKTIVPFATSGGSGIGDPEKYLAPSAPGAHFMEGKRIGGTEDPEALKIWTDGIDAVSGIYSYSVPAPNGEALPLSAFRGKVMLIVNTATGCGFTPHYEKLQAMYDRFHDRGLEIIDIPCNQFGAQAPGSDDDIHAFCTLHYNTTFPQMKKSDVNGENELPLYAFLKARQGFKGLPDGQYSDLLRQMFAKADPDWDKKPDIKWNFTKFIVDREGSVVARFEPTADMADVEKCIVSLL